MDLFQVPCKEQMSVCSVPHPYILISNITRDVFFRVFENREYRIMMQSTRNYTDTLSLNYNDVSNNTLLARFNRLDLLEISINGADVCEVLSIEIGSVVLIESKFKTPANNQLF